MVEWNKSKPKRQFSFVAKNTLGGLKNKVKGFVEGKKNKDHVGIPKLWLHEDSRTKGGSLSLEGPSLLDTAKAKTETQRLYRKRGQPAQGGGGEFLAKNTTGRSARLKKSKVGNRWRTQTPSEEGQLMG